VRISFSPWLKGKIISAFHVWGKKRPVPLIFGVRNGGTGNQGGKKEEKGELGYTLYWGRKTTVYTLLSVGGKKKEMFLQCALTARSKTGAMKGGRGALFAAKRRGTVFREEKGAFAFAEGGGGTEGISFRFGPGRRKGEVLILLFVARGKFLSHNKKREKGTRVPSTPSYQYI